MTSLQHSPQPVSPPPAPDPHSLPSPVLRTVERRLKLACVITFAFGLVFASGSHDATDGLVRWLSDVAFLRIGDGVASLTNTNHLADAILGGVMCGWAVSLWMLFDRFLASHPHDTKQLALVSMAVWFLIDSAGSIASGAWLNAVGNVAFLAMFALPLRALPTGSAAK